MTPERNDGPLTRHLAAEQTLFLAEVLRGLSRRDKELPCKYFYDERGSQLFEAICQLEEYYLTRTELALMHQHVHEMAARLGPDCLLIEYGSGSSLKTRLLPDGSILIWKRRYRNMRSPSSCRDI